MVEAVLSCALRCAHVEFFIFGMLGTLCRRQLQPSTLIFREREREICLYIYDYDTHLDINVEAEVEVEKLVSRLGCLLSSNT